MRSVAVIGPHGQLGTDLVKGFRSAGWAVTAVGHDTVAVEDRDSVEAFLGANPVDVVVNTAAFHQVAACEKDIARTWAVNAGGPRNVAVAARRTGAVAVFISTDYVFNGEIDATHSYPEDAGVSLGSTSRTGARSRVNQNTEPWPNSEETPNWPPIRSISLAQIDNPRPLPP